MADYVALTDGQVDENSPLDETLFTQIQQNQINHDDRIAALEDTGIRVFSHFNSEWGYSSGVIISGSRQDGFLFTEDAGALDIQNAQALNHYSPDEHYIRFLGGSGAAQARMRAFLAAKYDDRTKPITFTARVRLSTHSNTLLKIRAGLLHRDVDASIAVAPNSGVWLESASSSQWIFKCRNAGGTVESGTPFTPPEVATNWMEIKIVYTDDPSEQALCYVDDVLMETLAANLPTSRKLYGIVQYEQLAATSGQTIDVDRVLVSLGGPLADMA